MTLNPVTKASERGNVLFLILIAVALFAALSYVVTQSTRSGGGSTEREQNILSSAQMTQYPTALRTAIIRMILSGVSAEELLFNDPSAFSGVSTNLLVFHPQGGGAVFQEAPLELMAGGAIGQWNFNADFEVPGIGIDGAGGNDLIAFLRNISVGICRQTNEELGLAPADFSTGCATAAAATGGVPAMANSLTNIGNNRVTSGAVFPGTAGAIIDSSGACAGIFTRKASGCFWDGTNSDYVFYSVLLER